MIQTLKSSIFIWIEASIVHKKELKSSFSLQNLHSLLISAKFSPPIINRAPILPMPLPLARERAHAPARIKITHRRVTLYNY
jgi:hypothetical protein